MNIRASAISSMVSKATIVWLKKLIQLIPENNRHVIETANYVLKASFFTTDATLDTPIFSARAIASLVEDRRILWLKAWLADNQSKSIVTRYPLQRNWLFGDSLDKILIEARDKKKAMLRYV